MAQFLRILESGTYVRDGKTKLIRKTKQNVTANDNVGR